MRRIAATPGFHDERQLSLTRKFSMLQNTVKGLNTASWAFFSFRRLRECIVGAVRDPTYEAVARALFIIQKTKAAFATSISGTIFTRIGDPDRKTYNPLAPID